MTCTLPFPPLAEHTTWAPSAPPTLDGLTQIALDLETTGLRWWDGDRPIGLALTSDRGTQYLPWGHRGGGNLDEATVKRWAQRELRNKTLVNLNTRFDLHFLREWGVDLEAQGCTVSDVAHSAALLDDHRTRFSLDRLAQDFLGEEKVGKDLDVTRMSDYHAGQVAPRAEADTRQVWDLEAVFDPQLTQQNLQKVKRLENEVIWVVVEMEKNGSPIDEAQLDAWLTDSEQDYYRLLWDVFRDTNRKLNVNSTNDLTDLCSVLHLPIHETPDGRPSFTDAVLEQYQHPVINKVRRARKLSSLRSKYLLKYRGSVGSDGLLRYALHQLRADDGGTVSGRFSSSAMQRGYGVNIQQVPSVEKQTAAMGPDYLIRALHRPASGLWLSADAEQIEYRLFADAAQNPDVLQAYADDPHMSFHNVVWEKMRLFKADLQYKQLKAMNFAKLYGGGAKRLANMLDLISDEQFQMLRRTHAGRGHPLLTSVMGIMKLYDTVLPEVSVLLHATAHEARTHGFVTTALGRRARLASSEVFKALNRKIQGTAADIMKTKLCALHRHRRDTGFTLRFTVHDEVCGDVEDAQSARAVQTILNHQSLPLSVPILWDVQTGPNWATFD